MIFSFEIMVAKIAAPLLAPPVLTTHWKIGFFVRNEIQSSQSFFLVHN